MMKKARIVIGLGLAIAGATKLHQILRKRRQNDHDQDEKHVNNQENEREKDVDAEIEEISSAEFAEDESDAKIREGAILAFELGKLFEPFVISILPLVSTCFDDPALPVREATVDAARAIMRNLSAQGVKLVLPSLLKGLSDSVWRTKRGGIQLLGTMAWCAPKQLSRCLSTIVSHQKVQKAAQLALDEVGATIRNPEVQELVPSLLSAIAQPNKFTRDCSEKLLDTVFVNTINAPSLAQIIPVVHRGLKDRSGEVKKRASRIVQNLCKLVNDPKDMAPYVTLLVPGLQKAIVDPLPAGPSADVRAQASKGLGSLMGDMGRDALQDVMPWLTETKLKSKGSSVERYGAAQALAEVLAVYGTSYFESILPQILEDCRAPTAAIREGDITLFRFLPSTMCDTFQTHLDAVLPLILDGLADENEGVREKEEGLSNDNIVQYHVRSASLHIWKTVVVNTPKTLGEILPALMDYMIETLAHSGEDGRLSAGRCLGELVRKMGERPLPWVLPSILPILKGGTESESPATRQGVCYGLSEVLDDLTRSQLTDHLPMVLPAIQATLCDQDPEVREAAAGAFNALFKAGAGSVVDTIVPALLAQLQSDSGNSQALEGLQVILSVRPQTLNSMVPRLLHKPISVTNLQALWALASAAGASLQAHLPTILPAVLSLASMESGKPVEEAAKVDVSEHTAVLITALVPLLAEDNEIVVKTCWTALGSVTATIPKDTQPSFVRCLKDAAASARDKERRKMTGEEIWVHGFCLPKGLGPVLQSELATEGLGELVELTSTKMLRPFVVQITVPLIRIIGDRFPRRIKLAILTTLGLLINKAGDGLEAFVPQLRATFLKCLQDPTPNVRDQAAKNLGQLARRSPTVDQLAVDLSGDAARRIHSQVLDKKDHMKMPQGENIVGNTLDDQEHADMLSEVFSKQMDKVKVETEVKTEKIETKVKMEEKGAETKEEINEDLNGDKSNDTGEWCRDSTETICDKEGSLLRRVSTPFCSTASKRREYLLLESKTWTSQEKLDQKINRLRFHNARSIVVSHNCVIDILAGCVYLIDLGNGTGD
ncbi:hypothetical protein BSKO_05763 [Bryopsis sp. KO-2023]|nr:hypothetical protein BSKO_05763 [Bryopsis sp. KO-2023]